MLSFGYCIWATPIENHEWNRLTNGFNIHMSVNTNLMYQECVNFIKNNNCNINIEVELDGDYIIDNTDGFYSMYFNVKCIGHKPVWWPDDAHISFLYEYDRQFTQLQIDNVINKLRNKKCVLTKLQTMKCIDHFNKWEKMK